MAAPTEEKKNNNDNNNKNLFPTKKVGTLNICPLINGLWQVGNGSLNKNVSSDELSNEMIKYSSVGLTTWDGADHYGPAEDIMGLHKEKLSKNKENVRNIYFTKWVPSMQKEVKYESTEKAIKKSLIRMKTNCLDLIQFHWWDYTQPDGYLKICQHFVSLQKKGMIENIGLCNFNTPNMKNIVENVENIKIVSNQIPYSIIDTRSENQMVPYCLKNNISLICYGVLLGGFLSNKYLGKNKQPQTKKDLSTASLSKYYKWIMSWSNNNWDLFQELLSVLNDIGKKYNNSTIAQIALRYVLDKPAVGGAIIGCRLTVSDHIDETVKIFGIKLTDDDRKLIEDVVKKGRPLRGEPADEYRGVKL